jgi:hypothetical protein
VYVLPDYSVRIFSTTEELAAFLQAKARLLFVDVLSDPSFIPGFVFLLLIGIITWLGFYADGTEKYNKEAFIALTSVLGAAAGFFFGTKKL